MKRLIPLVAVALVAVLILGLIGVGPLRPLFHRSISADAHGGIVRLQLEPTPEGPSPPWFEKSPTNQSSKALDLVQRYIPDPLPATVPQWGCNTGGDLVVTFADGTVVTYGPCHRPASIDRLWAHMVSVLQGGRCEPHCGPNWP
jgi:hypothetical protein